MIMSFCVASTFHVLDLVIINFNGQSQNKHFKRRERKIQKKNMKCNQCDENHVLLIVICTRMEMKTLRSVWNPNGKQTSEFVRF